MRYDLYFRKLRSMSYLRIYDAILQNLFSFTIVFIKKKIYFC